MDIDQISPLLNCALDFYSHYPEDCVFTQFFVGWYQNMVNGEENCFSGDLTLET